MEKFFIFNLVVYNITFGERGTYFVLVCGGTWRKKIGNHCCTHVEKQALFSTLTIRLLREVAILSCGDISVGTTKILPSSAHQSEVILSNIDISNTDTFTGKNFLTILDLTGKNELNR